MGDQSVSSLVCHSPLSHNYVTFSSLSETAGLLYLHISMHPCMHTHVCQEFSHKMLYVIGGRFFVSSHFKELEDHLCLFELGFDLPNLGLVLVL